MNPTASATPSTKPSFKISKKLIFFGVLAALIVGGIVWARQRGAQETYETVAARRGSVVEEISVTGSIAPMSKVDLQPQVSGRVVRVAVREGDTVATGDVLLELDAGDINAQVAGQRASLAAARARLNELEAGATAAELAVSESAVSTAQSRLDAARAAETDARTALVNAERRLANAEEKAQTLVAGKLDLAMVQLALAVTSAEDAMDRLTGPLFTVDGQLAYGTTDFMAQTNAVHTRLAAKSATAALRSVAAAVHASSSSDAVVAAVSSALAQLATVKGHLEILSSLVSSSTVGIPPTTLTTYQANVNTALTSVNAAMQGLTGVRSDISLQQRLNDAEVTGAEIALADVSAGVTSAGHAVETAVRSLEQARTEADLRRAGNRPEVVASQRARVQQEEAVLSQLLNEHAKRVIVAPTDGTVTGVAVRAGETVQPSMVAVTIHAVGEFEIMANISEIDIARLRIGDPVAITIDAFPRSERWTGTVRTVHPAEKVVDGIIFYEARIIFDVEDERLRSGMTANLIIETARRDDTIVVPYRAVLGGNGATFVEVLRAGTVENRPVTVGLEGIMDVEIATGLAEGELVVLSRSGR